MHNGGKSSLSTANLPLPARPRRHLFSPGLCQRCSGSLFRRPRVSGDDLQRLRRHCVMVAVAAAPFLPPPYNRGFPRLLQLERREEQRRDEAPVAIGRTVDLEGARARSGSGLGPRVWYVRWFFADVPRPRCRASRPSGAHGHAAAPITLGCWRGEGHGSPVDVAASVCLSREAPRGRAADGMVIRRPWSAFSDVDITQPPVRITGGD